MGLYMALNGIVDPAEAAAKIAGDVVNAFGRGIFGDQWPVVKNIGIAMLFLFCVMILVSIYKALA